MVDLDAVHAAAPSPLQLARLLGLRVAPGARPDRCRTSCPFHDEKRPSFDLARRNGRLVGICRSCGEGGDIFAIVGAVRGLDARRDFRRVAEAAAELVGVRLDAQPWPARSARPKRRRDPAAELREAIEFASDRWVRGREVRPDPVIENATADEILDALADLMNADISRRRERREAA